MDNVLGSDDLAALKSATPLSEAAAELREIAAGLLASDIVDVVAGSFQRAAATTAAVPVTATDTSTDAGGMHDFKHTSSNTALGVGLFWEELGVHQPWLIEKEKAYSGVDWQEDDFVPAAAAGGQQLEQRFLRGGHRGKSPSHHHSPASGHGIASSEGGVVQSETKTGRGFVNPSSAGELNLGAADCGGVEGGAGDEGGGEADLLQIENKWLNIALTAVCVVCAGLAAGLTMGLVSIEPLEMAIKQRSGESCERDRPRDPGRVRGVDKITGLPFSDYFWNISLFFLHVFRYEYYQAYKSRDVPSHFCGDKGRGRVGTW